MDNAANSLMTALIDAGNIDTVYRDVYLDRARTLLAPVLSLEEFHRVEQQRAALAELPVTIAHALETANWSLVKELSQRAQTLKHVLDDKSALLQTARSVYDALDVQSSPFSPGLQSFTRIPAREWPTLRTRALELLGTLERADGPWNDSNAARRHAFEARPQTASDMLEPDAATSSPTDALEAARQALKAGDMKRLAALADALSAGVRQSGPSSSHAENVGSAPAEGESAQQLQPVAHSSETLARARRLGLASRHLEPRTELASLRQYAWTPLSDERGNSGAAQLRLPSGMPEALRDGLAVFMIHPLVNSGGARYLPSLVAEDVLVEDFPDPVDGSNTTGVGAREEPRTPGSAKLAAHHHRAGAAHARRPHSRERARARPARLPSGVHPPDVYVRLGEAEGWGDSHSGLTSMVTSSGRSTARYGYRPSPAATSATAASTICWRRTGST